MIDHSSSHAAGRPSGDLAATLRQLAADGAILATVAAMVGLYAVSAVTMEHFGIAYVSSGGGPLSKIHPSFLLCAGALGLRCLASAHPARTAWRLATDDAGIVLLLLAVAVTAAHAVTVAKAPFTGVLDTFVLPIFCFLLLRDLDPTLRKWIALLVGAVLCVNAIMAVMEFLGHYHFIGVDVAEGISADPTRGDAGFDWKAQLVNDWRPTALLGHPLVNGLVVQAMICCLIARGSRWLPWPIKGPLLLGQCVAMATFGARTSLVLSVVVAGFFLVNDWSRALARGGRLQPRQVAIALGIVALAIVTVTVASDTAIFDRTFDRFANDAGSADARVVMLDLFQHSSWSELLLGPDQDVIATWQRLDGLEFGIESSWVGLALTYGLVVTAMILCGLAAFSRSIVRATGPGAAPILLAFFLAVSGSASMSGKTTVFAETVVLVQLFLYRDEGWRGVMFGGRDVLSSADRIRRRRAAVG